MANEAKQYNFTQVKAIRGTEAKTIATKEKEGWELVDQQQGRLRTTMNFRRPKPETPWRLWAALGGAAVVLLAVGLVTGVLEDDGSDASATEALPTSSSAQPSREPAPEPAPEPEPVPEPAAPVPLEILTIENNEDLARVLEVTDTCGQPIADFAAQYAGRTIQFDGHIAALNNHGSYDTRYDILIGRGDFSETNPAGPNFQFRNVNIVSDLRLTGPGIPDAIGVNDTLRVTAVVDKYEENTCLSLLDPVTTEYR